MPPKAKRHPPATTPRPRRAVGAISGTTLSVNADSYTTRQSASPNVVLPPPTHPSEPATALARPFSADYDAEMEIAKRPETLWEKNVSDVESKMESDSRDDSEIAGTAVEKKKTMMVKKKKVVKVVVKKLVKKKVPKMVRKSLALCSNSELEKIANLKQDELDFDRGSVQEVGMVGSLVSNPTEEINTGASDSTPVRAAGMEVHLKEGPVDFDNGISGLVEEGGKFGSSNGSYDLGVSLSMEETDNNNDHPMKVEKAQIMKVCEGEDDFVGEIQMDCKENESLTENYGEHVNLDSVEERRSDGKNEDEMVTSVEEERKEEVGKGDECGMGNAGIMVSGETDVLERRRRRKTEIFVGGLNTDTKEEDVRKVFADLGDVAEVRMMVNNKTGKKKGYAFVRYASSEDAKKALEKFPKVEICGKQCSTAPVEGNDTIFLGNIDKKWKNEDVIELLEDIGIEKIDKVTVVVDPRNSKHNRGFSFIEFESNKDAKIAFNKLQKMDVMEKLKNIKVAWAEPLSEPDEEELLKVKSVYVEHLPLSWNEEKVINCFKKFGEIENVVLARNLQSSKRKDFAFINYSNREAALACIGSFNHEMLTDEESKVNLKVSLAKPIAKGKSPKKVAKPIKGGILKQKLKAAQRAVRSTSLINKGTAAIGINNKCTSYTRSLETRTVTDFSGPMRLTEPIKKGATAIHINNDRTGGRSSLEAAPFNYMSGPLRPSEPGIRGLPAIQINSNTAGDTRALASADLEQILADRALWRQKMARLDYSGASLTGGKRPFSLLADDLYNPDPRGYSRIRTENSFIVGSPSFGLASPHQFQSVDHVSNYRHTDNASSFQGNSSRAEAVIHSIHYRRRD